MDASLIEWPAICVRRTSTTLARSKCLYRRLFFVLGTRGVLPAPILSNSLVSSVKEAGFSRRPISGVYAARTQGSVPFILQCCSRTISFQVRDSYRTTLCSGESDGYDSLASRVSCGVRCFAGARLRSQRCSLTGPESRPWVGCPRLTKGASFEDRHNARPLSSRSGCGTEPLARRLSNMVVLRHPTDQRTDNVCMVRSKLRLNAAHRGQLELSEAQPPSIRGWL